MTVNINFLNFGSPPVTSFSDSMAVGPAFPRNPISPPSDKWIYIPLGGDTPTAGAALPSFAFAIALNGGGFGLGISQISYAFTTYSFSAGITPVSMFVGSRFYNASQKFVQYTFDRISNGSVGIGICNYVDATGVGSNGSGQINHDCYLVDQGGGGAGVPGLIRFNSGANNVILNAGTGTLQQGDVCRVGFDFTNPAQVSIQVSTNGVLRYTQVDNAANRLTGPAFPIIACYSMGGAGVNAGSKNFSCGIGL